MQVISEQAPSLAQVAVSHVFTKQNTCELCSLHPSIHRFFFPCMHSSMHSFIHSFILSFLHYSTWFIHSLKHVFCDASNRAFFQSWITVIDDTSFRSTAVQELLLCLALPPILIVPHGRAPEMNNPILNPGFLALYFILGRWDYMIVFVKSPQNRMK